MPTGSLTSLGRGRYVVERLLGRGGMSAVYVARDNNIAGRLVAIKEMVDQFADEEERRQAEHDFAREADMLAMLRHPAIPAIYDRFSENSRHLLVMEYIAGENLERLLTTHGPYDEDQVRAWASELCSVLAYLHSQHPPVVFRDLKPGNIIVQPDGRVRLIDFGIARLFKPQQKADTTALGTSGYASPEHYTGQTDARSDIYSLGATMHHLLTGRDPSKFPPFQFPPVRDLNPQVSPELAAVVAKAVQDDREKRFATVDEMRASLERKKRKARSNPATTLPAPAPSQGNGATPAVAAAPASAPVPLPAQPTILPARRQVLVLESLAPGRHLDVDAVAAHVVALTGGDTASMRAILQRGLPVTLPLAPGMGTPANVQALSALGLRARVVSPGVVPVLLDADLRRRLDTTHQLLVRDVTVGPARICHCRRCSYTWKTTKAVGDPVPMRCPNCRSTDWGRWRIFKCAWCGHEFDTGDVDTRRPERLFPTCPCCGLANWETGRASSRTGWLDRLLAALVGTA